MRDLARDFEGDPLSAKVLRQPFDEIPADLHSALPYPFEFAWRLQFNKAVPPTLLN